MENKSPYTKIEKITKIIIKAIQTVGAILINFLIINFKADLPEAVLTGRAVLFAISIPETVKKKNTDTDPNIGGSVILVFSPKNTLACKRNINPVKISFKKSN